MKLEKVDERLAVPIILAIGLLLRVIVSLIFPIFSDGSTYADTAHGILVHHDFVTFSQELSLWTFSLTFPMYLAFFYKILGFGVFATRIAQLLLSFSAMLVSYYCTKDLYGKKKATIALVVVAFSPWLIAYTGQNFVENMVIIGIVPLVWALIKSKGDHRYLFLATVFGVFTLYTRSNTGLPFVFLAVLGLGGFLVYHDGKKVLKTPLLYVLLFSILAASIIRIVIIREKGFEKSEVEYFMAIFTASGMVQLAFQLFFTIFFPITYLLFFADEGFTALKGYKTRTGSLLILVIAGALLMILNHASGHQRWFEMVSGPSSRYFSTFTIPLMWLFFEGWENRNNFEKPKFLDNRPLMISKALFVMLVGIAFVILINPWYGLIVIVGAVAFGFLKSRKARIFALALAFLIAGIGSATMRSWDPQLPAALDGTAGYLSDGDTVGLVQTNTSFKDLNLAATFFLNLLLLIFFAVLNYQLISGAYRRLPAELSKKPAG